jgi:hypothetical protein
MNERWKFERGQPPARMADRGRYVTQAESLSFLGLNFLMGYYHLSELEHYCEMKPDTGVGLRLFQQSMTLGRFKFIS